MSIRRNSSFRRENTLNESNLIANSRKSGILEGGRQVQNSTLDRNGLFSNSNTKTKGIFIKKSPYVATGKEEYISSIG